MQSSSVDLRSVFTAFGVCLALGFAVGSFSQSNTGTALFASTVQRPTVSTSAAPVYRNLANTGSVNGAPYMRSAPQMRAESQDVPTVTSETMSTGFATGSNAKATTYGGLALIMATISAFLGMKAAQSSREETPIRAGRREVLAGTVGAGLSTFAGAAYARGDYNLDEPEEDRTALGITAAVLGVTVGLGAPNLYAYAERRDNERLEEIRQLNKEKFLESGETLTEEEVSELRPGRWADRREYADDD